MAHIREMTEADIDAVAEVRVRGWRSAYAGIVPGPYLDALTVEEDAARRREWFTRPLRRSLDLVAVAPGSGAADTAGPGGGADGTVVGWLAAGPCRDELPDGDGAQGTAGEVYALYVHPDRVGEGFGHALLTAAHSRLAERGHGSAVLWVLRDNHPARRFYARAGYQEDGAARDDVYDGVELTEVRCRRPLPPPPRPPFGPADHRPAR
ncbi:GNAT family N-acetyltransferase [Streptomyces clavuligerus]|uniref:Putative acetyltransferase n=2 Tax=Streptomyces clavuligerus TaxID=1901 RepID=B5H0R9_STRCL|nr:N-acetyltransferase [Streptomyces clavuligerus]ANW21643.1 acetyltransferase [Streptomyces clavuligerus]AXU16270.1 N-acetyltransferase [Streptomyces clavuligerus]EDY52164.1 acetyltransferase [Streptomyces clavuligerus]EFG05180.1 Putative acetyltransferase [Streptomyces clavuligerus]MBY6306427.1 GNAT family N-acetyltransferase [Streptomyces clavuligerus]